MSAMVCRRSMMDVVVVWTRECRSDRSRKKNPNAGRNLSRVPEAVVGLWNAWILLVFGAKRTRMMATMSAAADAPGLPPAHPPRAPFTFTFNFNRDSTAIAQDAFSCAHKAEPVGVKLEAHATAAVHAERELEDQSVLSPGGDQPHGTASKTLVGPHRNRASKLRSRRSARGPTARGEVSQVPMSWGRTMVIDSKTFAVDDGCDEAGIGGRDQIGGIVLDSPDVLEMVLLQLMKAEDLDRSADRAWMRTMCAVSRVCKSFRTTVHGLWARFDTLSECGTDEWLFRGLDTSRFWLYQLERNARLLHRTKLAKARQLLGDECTEAANDRQWVITARRPIILIPRKGS
jgi:hypothetical protein